ncbi:MAG: alanine:cation symporter family protein [Bacteroidales bacterium]|nr:alanine:cation symporter family protein [Bacteroidales bacterium]
MLEKIVSAVNDVVWSPALVVLLIAAGLYFSIRTRFVQVRRLKLMVKLLFSKKKEPVSDATASEPGTKGVSSFQAFCLAIAGRVGTGNIVGVATAIAMGGPGAIFWMWVIAFLGASTAFVESTLAQIYKFPHHTGWRGGPTCYIDNGLRQRWLGILFAVFTIIGYGLLLVTVQSNGAASAAHNAFNLNPLYGGIGLAVLLLLVISGGIKRSATVAEIITPIMAAVYILFSLIIICINYKAVPGVFNMIFTSAFGMHSVFGGIVGSAIAFGVKRGLFSNEAGEGGGAIISASADVSHPAKQGLVQAFSVYIDTLLVCTATALMILTSGTYNVFAPSGDMIVSSAPELGNNYVGFTQSAVDNVFGGFGAAFVSIALFFFVFTTLMAYDLYAESSIAYLFSYGKGDHRRIEKVTIWVYRLMIVGAVIFGAMREANVVWQMGDIGVGLTTWINVIVILILSPQAIRALKDLEKKDKEGTLE